MIGSTTATPATRHLLVVRDRAHQREALRRASDDLLVWTLPDLWERLSSWAALRLGLVRDDGAARWAMAGELARAGALLPRVAFSVDGLRRELVHAGTTAQAILEALGDSDADAQGRAVEVTVLLQRVARVERKLADAGVVDGAVALARARTLLDSGVRPGFLSSISRIEICDLLDATDLELALATGLGRFVSTVLHAPTDSANRGLLQGVEHVPRTVEAAFDVAGLHLEFDDLAAPPAAESVTATALHRLCGAFYGGTVAADAPARLAWVDDPMEEARTVAGVVAAWRRAWPGARIAVATRAGGQTLQPFAEALAGHGISSRRRRRTLKDTPAARLLLDAAELRKSGAPRDLLLSVLTNPARRTALAPEDGAQLLRTLRQAAARGDIEDSTHPVGGYRHRLERLAQRLPKLQADVDRALAIIDPILAQIGAVPLRAPAAAHLRALLTLAEGLIDEARGFGGADVRELLTRARAAIGRTDPGGGSVALSAVVRLVGSELDAAPFLDDVDDLDDDAVELCSLPELIGRQFDAVAIARVIEGELPQPPARGLLSDVDRARINQALRRQHARPTSSPRLRLVEDDRGGAAPVPRALAVEPVWFLGALRAPSRQLLVTAPRADIRGRELSPSIFFVELLRALGAGLDAPAAGILMDVELSNRDLVASWARFAGRTPDAPLPAGVAHGVARARLAAEMADQRSRFFFRAEDTAPADVRAPFAFQLDPRRVARAFGSSFGLMSERPLTPTRLEALAECRMHGFLQHVLKVDVDHEPGNALDARVLGTLAHAVLERFYLERARGKVPFTRMTDADRERLLAILDMEAAPILRGLATGHIPAIRAALSHLRSALLRVTVALARRPLVPGVEPVGFELQIGARTHDGKEPELASVPIEIAPQRTTIQSTTIQSTTIQSTTSQSTTIWLGGIIDRVDEGAGGRVVVDYKTMSAGSVRQKAQTSSLLDTHFQLLIYLRLLEHHRPTSERVGLHGYLVSLKDGVASADVAKLPNLRARLLDDTREDGLGQAIGRVVLPILEGTLVPDAGERCDGCRLQRVCRIPMASEFAVDPDEQAEDGA